MAEPRTLLSLPNEVLILLFENSDFPLDSLPVLARLCRRLNFLALPIYFVRHGMPSPSQSAVIRLTKDGHDMLAALKMALFVTSMKDIHFIFPHPSCSSILPLLPHLRRVRKFISRFPSIQKVILQLDARNSMCNSTGDDKTVRAWSHTLGSLLNCLVEKRCTEITVKYGGYLTRSYTLAATGPTKRVRRIVKAIRRPFLSRAAMEGGDWEFRRSPEQGQKGALTSVPTKVSRSSTLTSLHIQSAVLIMPPCLSWTLSALRQCPITSLSLFQISLKRDIWDAALSLIAKAAPKLTDLSLSELDSISDAEILTLCSRLPRLATLKIGFNEESQGLPTQCTKGRIPEFSNLTTLVAPTDFIRYFMRPRLCLPKLVSLRISFRGPTSIPVISAQLSDICRLMAARTLSPSISLSLSLYPSIAADFNKFLELPNDVKKYFTCVASLVLEVSPFNPSQIARWIRLIFPSVQHVSLTVTINLKPIADVYGDRLLQELSENRGSIQTIVVNGTRHVVNNLSRKI
ncbi:hypothetical protein K438DRAFT_1824320 [Mycena galopus ATCC 62051]|nr:hypothetical protein K438DRAFT_1824320 [Mycena galopus ATCC 62051]